MSGGGDENGVVSDPESGAIVPVEKSGRQQQLAEVVQRKKYPQRLNELVRVTGLSEEDHRYFRRGVAAEESISLGFDFDFWSCRSELELEALQSENGLLRKAVEDLRQEIARGSLNSGKYRGMESSGNWGSSNNEKKSQEGDVSEQLKKALMGA